MSGGLVGGDSAAFTQSFDNRNAGTGKTLTPTGTVTDGNAGANYRVTFVHRLHRRHHRPSDHRHRGHRHQDLRRHHGLHRHAHDHRRPGRRGHRHLHADLRQPQRRHRQDAHARRRGHRRQRGRELHNRLRHRPDGRHHRRPITVTAITDTKTYDGTTGSTGTPTITGGLGLGDSAAFTQSFDNRNAGTNKTLTPAGTITDGNAGLNYTIAFATTVTGVITARVITVTTVADTKAFDGTKHFRRHPDGHLRHAGWCGHQMVRPGPSSTTAAGTGKTLTPTGVVLDGNAGANYAVTFVSVTTGVITGRAITVTATSETKTYDAPASTAAIPTITTGTLASGDTAAFTQTFDNANVSTPKTLTPAGTVIDGNNGANYTITFATDTTGVITARAITVTATTDTKGYDATTALAAIPTITRGHARRCEHRDRSPRPSTPRTSAPPRPSTPAGSVSDGNGGANYAITFATNATGEITARAITVTASTDTKVYDSTTGSSCDPDDHRGHACGDRHGIVHPDLRHRERRHRQDPDAGRFSGQRRQRRGELRHHLRHRHHR